MWLLHFLPLPLLALLGNGFGLAVYALGRERRRVTRRNLELCFPEKSPVERERIVRGAFRSFGRSLLERAVMWHATPERIRRIVAVEGIEHWQAARGRPVILLAPHFVGLDMGWARLTCEQPMVSMYSVQKSPEFNAALLRGRGRFGSQLFSRQQGVKAVLKALHSDQPFYYLPDMDYGARDAAFVPFFGVAAATITALPRIAAVAGAAVVPCVTRMLPGGRGYVTRFYPAWEGYPSDDVLADTRRMNAFIEERVREMPEQYFWLHKRFKTRPEGEARVY
jgi:KDO2-lipid IV(A) lauroyltransferase